MMKHKSDKSPGHPKLVSGRIAFFFLAAAVNGHGLVEKKKRALVTEAGFLSNAIQRPSSVGTAIGIRSVSRK